VSSLSSEVNAKPIAAPTGPSATAGTGQNSVSWTAVTGATSYNIYWKTSSGVTTSDTKITGATSAYTHASLNAGTTYYYKIEAVNASGTSSLSSEVSATPTSSTQTATWNFASGASYTYDSNKIDVASNAATVKYVNQTDNSNSATGFAGGTMSGVSWTNSSLALSRALPTSGGSNSLVSMSGNVLLAELDETSGTLTDGSGSGNNGTSAGGVTYGTTGYS
jgi:hypothetical protein